MASLSMFLLEWKLDHKKFDVVNDHNSDDHSVTVLASVSLNDWFLFHPLHSEACDLLGRDLEAGENCQRPPDREHPCPGSRRGPLLLHAAAPQWNLRHHGAAGRLLYQAPFRQRGLQERAGALRPHANHQEVMSLRYTEQPYMILLARAAVSWKSPSKNQVWLESSRICVFVFNLPWVCKTILLYWHIYLYKTILVFV